MSNNFIRSSKQNPCPVCNRTKDSDCSWYPDGETVMCKTYVDGSGHDESKWHYTGVNELGFQGKFVPKTEKEFVKTPRPQSEKHYYYPDREGNNLVRVTRKDDGNGKKTFYQSHWDGGKWVKGNPDEIKKRIPIYRYKDVRGAISRGELIFAVEGEEVADTLWDLGIAATTTIGGSGGYAKYGDYIEDLKGARLVLAPDRDANGLKYIANFERDFPEQIESYYLAGSQGLWANPSGGMDIGDDIQDHSYSKEQILDRLVNTDKYRDLTQASSTLSNVVRRRKSKKALGTLERDYESLARRLGFKLILNEDGVIESKLVRLTLDLFDLVGDRLKLNLMTREYEYEGKPVDLNNAQSFIAQNLGYDASTEKCILAIHAIANKWQYHPVREYLESLRGKSTDIDLIANFPQRYFGNCDPLQNRLFFRKLIACIARVMNPGTKDDSLLVLQGGQGVGKSTAIKALAGDDWFNDDLRSLDDKDEIAKLSRFWLLELAEVDYLFSKKEVELFKRFLSCTEDTFRPPYGRANILVKRTCGLFASTNKSEFLTDPTGDRRYWVVEVKQKIDIESIRRDRNLIWASALAAYEAGHQHYLDPNEQIHHSTANTQWRDEDPWVETILPNLNTILKSHGSIEYVSIQDIMDRILNIPTDRQDKRQRNRIGGTLQMAGFERKPVQVAGKLIKVWAREKSISYPSPAPYPSLESWVSPETLSEPTIYLSYLTYPSLESIEDIEKLKMQSSDLENNNLENNSLSEKLGKKGKISKSTPESAASKESDFYPTPYPTILPSELGKNPLRIGDSVENLRGEIGQVVKFRTHLTPRKTKIPQALVSFKKETRWVDLEVLTRIESGLESVN